MWWRSVFIEEDVLGDNGEGDLPPPSQYNTSKTIVISSVSIATPDLIDDFVTKLDPWVTPAKNQLNQMKAASTAAKFLAKGSIIEFHQRFRSDPLLIVSKSAANRKRATHSKKSGSMKSKESKGSRSDVLEPGEGLWQFMDAFLH